MILVHRLKGEAMFLNADLMESIQATPDTVITMVDGRKLVVAESAEEIVDRIRDFRASILAAADEFRSTDRSGSLIVFPGRKTDDEEDES
ncbi:MAG: flagellar FlbD family protein [Acidimicrobiia bacterium]